MDALSPDNDESSSRIGALVDGRYKILEAMASGSMGAVYKAERIPVGKIVAIKFLHASFANDSEFQTRFERETRVMSKLSHPNCVSVVDFGVWEGAPYLVMEYVGGTTLRAMIDKEPIAPQRALHLTRQIAAGLAHAHAQGIVHRDIKPANIMITEEIGTGDHVRILDFGLARLRGNVGRDATQTNVVVGTPNYMAPEQTIGGGTIDARTDVYAVGVVLFEMIAGERPFSADDTLQLLGMHRGAPIPLLMDRIAQSIILPEGLQELVEKAMAKSPDDRFQSAIELSEAIDKLIGPRVSANHKIPTRRERMKTDPAAVAPTLVRVDSERISEVTEVSARPKSSSSFGSFVLLLLLIGGAAAAVYFLKIRPTQAPAVQPAMAPTDAALAVASADAPLVIDSSAAPTTIDAPEVVAAITDAGVELDATMLAGSDGGLDTDATVADEIEMDPMAAINPDPAAEQENDAEDEAPDAPHPDEDIEKKVVPATPVRASTVREAVQMIKDGKKDLALASLHALWKKSPNSAYIPFLLGNIYNDRLWWSVAMKHYKIAIAKNKAYRGNAVLNKNVIKMLASTKTARDASTFIRWTIGRSAGPYLRSAAKNHKNPNVRKRAAALAKSIR